MTQKIDNFTLLVGCHDERGLLRFPSENPERPGLTCKLEQDLDAKTLIRSKLLDFLKKDLSFQLVKIIEEAIVDASGLDPSYLVLVKVKKEQFIAPSDWATLPVILRSLPRGKPRLIYNKAFQVLAGADQGDIAALEIDEEVRERLQELIKDGKL